MNYEDRFLSWIDKIADNSHTHEVFNHIIKHIFELSYRNRSDKESFNRWCNSLINLIFIYRATINEPLLDYEKMHERLVNRSKKKLPRTVFEDGSVI